MGSYKKIGLSHEKGLIDTPPLKFEISFPSNKDYTIHVVLNNIKCRVFNGDIRIAKFYSYCVKSLDNVAYTI